MASLVEIAKALAGDPHPRRSVLFLALFGEEEGLLGSAYYVRHPLIPLARTVADINLEQLGRTDSSDGAELARFAFTGPSYSNLPTIMGAAAKTAGRQFIRRIRLTIISIAAIIIRLRWRELWLIRWWWRLSFRIITR